LRFTFVYTDFNYMANLDDFFFEKLNQHQTQNWVREIDSKKIFNWIDDLFYILFPENALDVVEIKLQWFKSKYNFTNILNEILENKSEEEISQITDLLFLEIANVYYSLQKDAQAILDTDPAADCISEIINSYPGFLAIAFYRIANVISKHEIPMLPRIISEYAHSKTGIDIHPNANIDVPFVIDHGTGIVIGETCIIGKNVCIYQGVTLGALQVDKSMEEKKRHPTVEDGVIIYANATILGGSTVIGNHSVIGGNTFITKSVNPYSVVMQSSKNNIVNQQEIKDNNSFNI
jgi:serine O-acetyltransferase